MSQPQPSANQASVPTKSTLADWTAVDDDGYEYTREKRQRGGRKKRKKNFETQVAQNWDDIYDPSRPTNYAEYRHSDEQIAEIREWKDLLYAHTRRRSPSRYSDGEDDDRPRKSMFLSFAISDDAQTKKIPQDNLRLRATLRRRRILTMCHHQLLSPMTHPVRMHLLAAQN